MMGFTTKGISLHRAPGLAPAEGIVDALEYDRSWDLVARDVDRVNFIGTGSETADAGALLAHPRWRALHAGFKSEDALLLVFCDATALPRLGATPDAVVALGHPVPGGLSFGNRA